MNISRERKMESCEGRACNRTFCAYCFEGKCYWGEECRHEPGGLMSDVIEECPDCRYEHEVVSDDPCSRCTLGSFDDDAELMFEKKEES